MMQCCAFRKNPRRVPRVENEKGRGGKGGILSSFKLEEYEYELFARAFSTRIDRVSFVEGRGIFLERGIELVGETRDEIAFLGK